MSLVKDVAAGFECTQSVLLSVVHLSLGALCTHVSYTPSNSLYMNVAIEINGEAIRTLRRKRPD